MTLKSYTLGWALAVLLCFKLFHGVRGNCGSPPVIPHTNPVEENSGIEGQTIIYTCDRKTNYYEIPNKSTTITCKPDGTWTTIEEFCTRGCGVPERLDFAELNTDSLSENIYVPNTKVSYKCRPGYVRSPGSTNSITCLEDYTWSVPDVFCQRRSCGNPGEAENGNMEATDFLFGSRVTYTCNEGFSLSSRRPYRDCEADGSWSNTVPQCDAIICSAPDLPVNGTYQPQKDEYNYLDSITFSCKEPLAVAGTASIFCTATGGWSSSSPTCKAVNCPDPTVANSERLSGFQGPYSLNSAIVFKCKGNRALIGSSSILCNIDSQWEPSIPKCESVTCARPDKPANVTYQPQKDEYNYLDTVTFSCLKPLVIVGATSVSCTATKEWSSSSPTCKVVTCGKLEPVQNGKVSAPNDAYGFKAIYTCNERYGLTSLNYRICQENGTWSGSAPFCEAKCEDPPKPTFATLTESLGPYLNGTIVRYECKQGFIHNPGKERTLTCTGHSWSRLFEFCIRRSCGDPGTIKNGNVSVQDHLFGSRTIYSCEEGFSMNTTQNYRECQADGTWSNPIDCKEKSEQNGLGAGGTAGIILAAGAVLCAGGGVAYTVIKKKNEGKLQPSPTNVQYSHCKVSVPEEPMKISDGSS